MKRLLVAAFLFLVSIAAVAQIEIAPAPQATRWLLQAHRSEFAMVNEQINLECIVVFSDGRLHIERTTQEMKNLAKPSTRVFEAKLSEHDLATMQAVLDNPEFRKLDRLGMKGGMSNADESIQAFVLHENSVQQFNFPDMESRRSYTKQLKPFQDWWHSIDKRKIPPDKAAKSNNCSEHPTAD